MHSLPLRVRSCILSPKKSRQTNGRSTTDEWTRSGNESVVTEKKWMVL